MMRLPRQSQEGTRYVLRFAMARLARPGGVRRRDRGTFAPTSINDDDDEAMVWFAREAGRPHGSGRGVGGR